MKILVRYPTVPYGYVDVEREISDDSSAGEAAKAILRGLEEHVPADKQPNRDTSGGSQSKGGNGGYPDKPDPRESDDERDAGNRKQIIEHCEEIAQRINSSPKAVCFDFTDYQGKGGTENPNKIATNRLYPILKNMEKKLESLTGQGEDGGQSYPQDDDEPPF